MPRSRNYKAEYQRRLERAFAKGLSRAQARGHAKPGEKTLRPAKPKDQDKLEAALLDMRRSGSQTAAARAHHIAPETLRRFVQENALAERNGRSWLFTDARPRMMKVTSNGDVRTTRLAGFDQASLNGQHQAAIRTFLATNDVSLLAKFAGKSVIDAKGQAHPLETNPNTLHRLAAAGDEVFHEIYRLIL